MTGGKPVESPQAASSVIESKKAVAAKKVLIVRMMLGV
jgi:hypothetical protein